MNPKISVIVPAYNTEKYLRRCIDSILAQTFTDFELLLIDDGSTDQSGEICDEYADKDVRIKVFHKANGGVSSARNVGLDNALGEYICFCDADDWVDNDYFEQMRKKSIKCAEVLVPYSIPYEYVVCAAVVNSVAADKLMNVGFDKPIEIEPRVFF